MAFVRGWCAGIECPTNSVWTNSDWTFTATVDPDYNASLVPYRPLGRTAGGYEHCWRLGNVSGILSPEFPGNSDGLYSFLCGVEGISSTSYQVATEWSLYAADGTKIVRCNVTGAGGQNPTLTCYCGDALAISAVSTFTMPAGVIFRLDIEFITGAAGKFRVRVNNGAWLEIVANGNPTTCTKNVARWYAYNNGFSSMDVLAFWYTDDSTDVLGMVWADSCIMNSVTQVGSYSASATTILADTTIPYNSATYAVTTSDPSTALQFDVDWDVDIEAGFAPTVILGMQMECGLYGDGTLISADIGFISGAVPDTGTVTTSVSEGLYQHTAVVDPNTTATWTNVAAEAATVTANAA